jgi:hypothetical protein
MKLFILGILSTMNGGLLAMVFAGPDSNPPWGVGWVFLTVIICVVAWLPDDWLPKS